MPPPTFSHIDGLATALPEIFDHGPTTLAVLVVFILAGPYIRRDVARLLRASADVLDTPSKG